jgi:sulfatase maturation enzyme AslB (radical SAM superfamily)
VLDFWKKDTAHEAFAIESGYFVLTLMPSLRCKLNCPHCYLSLDERRNSPTMTLDDLATACKKIDQYYEGRGLQNKTIVCYWYGGEPTDMGMDYFLSAIELINRIFSKEKGYAVKHTVLSSLVVVDPVWFDFFKTHCDNQVQSSFDGLMRGKGYLKKWEQKIRLAKQKGLRVSTISVVNRALIDDTPEQVLDYLAGLGVEETSWLPFMWNEENNGDPYRKYAPSMKEWSDFMKRLTAHAWDRKAKGLFTPEIGQEWFILSQGERGDLANLPAQTLFLMPNGDFVLPDYKNGFQEFMQPFGNILSQTFQEVLQSPARKAYLRKQVSRDQNPECASCEHADKCVMEFWKKNRPGDDCFGGKEYVDWLLAHSSQANKEEKQMSIMY